MAEFYDVNVLDAALREAGIPIDGCSSDGRIDYQAEATAVQKQQGAQILAEYDPDVALWIEVRNKRDALLAASDHVLMPDYPMEDRSAWESYRQELRDIPQAYSDIEEIAWPEDPEE